MGGPNHPFVVWGSSFLWLTSMFAIIWSLILFFYLGEILFITETDLVIAILLLSGIIMLPTNLYMLYSIANGVKINHTSKLLCCPLWVLIMWIIVVNCVGIALCVQRIYLCSVTTVQYISHCMKHYRNVPKYKHFMDNLQWSLKCCGLDSYKDWFTHDWYDKLREYEWNPVKKSLKDGNLKGSTVSDSVPLSCCKSGTCVSNYLLELGTHSINTRGCSQSMYRLYMIIMNAQLILFFCIVVTEVMLLSCIIGKAEDGKKSSKKKDKFNVRHLMPINDKFETTSCSSHSEDEPDDAMKQTQMQSDETAPPRPGHLGP